LKASSRAGAFWTGVRRGLGRIWLRLLLVNVVVVLVPLFGLEFARIFERRLLHSLEQNMHDQAAIVRALLAADLAQGIALGDPRHADLLRTAAKDTRTRIRVLGAQGEVLADSHGAGVPEGPEPAPPRYFGSDASRSRHERSALGWGNAESWPEVARRQEVVAALSGEAATQTRVARRPHAVFLFSAVPVRANGADGTVAGAVYSTRSTAPVLMDLYRVRAGLFKLLAATLFLSVSVTLLLALSISRPLTLLSRAAKRIASGERSAPLPEFGTVEIRELSQSFRAMTEQLEQRLAYISELSADVAHEFKSPLTSIRGAAELLATGAHAEPQARDRFLHNILLDTDRLDRLVSRLLLLSRIEASAEEMTLVDLRGLLERTVHRARERGPLELDYASSQTWVRGREADLETAIVNLLDNAQRYSPSSAAVVLDVQDESGGVRVSIRDRGPGIPEARREKVWARFYTTEAESGGTGLGLAIVESVVRAHGGRAAYSPLDGGGSCFYIWLPSAAKQRQP
jgi:two-component system sensor histidine kinase ChvG